PELPSFPPRRSSDLRPACAYGMSHRVLAARRPLRIDENIGSDNRCAPNQCRAWPGRIDVGAGQHVETSLIERRRDGPAHAAAFRSEEHTSELQSPYD